MRSRPSRWTLAAVGGAVVALLSSGCTFHPGQAAVVNGHKISQDDVDDLVKSGCDFFVAGGGTKSVVYLRHLFTSDLITFELVDELAAEQGLTASPAAVAKAEQGNIPSLPNAMSKSDQERLLAYFHESTRANVLLAVIGAHDKDPSVTTAEKVQISTIQVGRKTLRKWAPSQAVTVNPAYGTWAHGQLTSTDGSLSAGKSTNAVRWLRLRAANTDLAGNGDNVEGLPNGQTCG